MENVDAFYAKENIQQSSRKAVNGVIRGGRLWGAEVDGLRGEVGAPAVRRVGVLCLCLLWLAFGCGRQVAEAMLGCISARSSAAWVESMVWFVASRLDDEFLSRGQWQMKCSPPVSSSSRRSPSCVGPWLGGGGE